MFEFVFDNNYKFFFGIKEKTLTKDRKIIKSEW